MARQSKREDIVDAALMLFHTKGFNAAGVKDITDAAGAPKGSFYNHFPSKEALAVIALERYGATRRLEALADRKVPAMTRLREHFTFLRDEVAGTGYRQGCLFGNFSGEIVDHSEVLRGTVAGSLRQWQDAIAGAIADGLSEGTVRQGLDPAVTARFVLDAWEGVLLDARAERGTASFDAFFEVVFGSLLV
jgi:TetR/AcrR family transcriptional regulator, transcriptional repressor for nem operon